jgi:hypothetical protein
VSELLISRYDKLLRTNHELIAERDALGAQLFEIREIYAGMEGVYLRTPLEKYLHRLIVKMYKETLEK